MKKFYVMMAAALVAFSLASCNKKGQNEPEPSKGDEPVAAFNIQVSDIEATTALVTVTPADTNIYYYFDLISEEEIAAGYNEDSLAANMKAAIEYYGYEFPKYLSKGVDSYDFTGLLPETEYTVYALQIDSNYNAVGKWTLKKFTTAQVVVTETVNVNGTGEIQDYSAIIGMFAVYADLEEPEGAYLGFVFDGETAEGLFTLEDIDADYGAWVVLDEDNDISYPIVSLNVAGAYNEASEYIFQGEAIGGNGVKYVIDITCPAESGNDAPKKVALRKDVKGLKNFKFQK